VRGLFCAFGYKIIDNHVIERMSKNTQERIVKPDFTSSFAAPTSSFFEEFGSTAKGSTLEPINLKTWQKKYPAL
jgi:hypothetical protein